MFCFNLHSDEIVDNLGESWLAKGRGVNRSKSPGRMVPERTVRITTHRASAPRFTFKPQSRVVETGQTARLICGVRGNESSTNSLYLTFSYKLTKITYTFGKKTKKTTRGEIVVKCTAIFRNRN